jgi:threonine/homoserine/homoserine lactone efflux protein
MFGTHDLPLFVLSGLLLNITPGADSLFIITRSVTQGARAGAVAALGVSVGCCVHVIAAALGLSALLATSASAFTVIKLIGAAYLVYIGVSLLRTRAAVALINELENESSDQRLPASSMSAVFAQGFLTNLLNPKVALFFLAFVPQFIDSGATDKTLAFLFLGAVFNFNGLLWCLLLAWSAARVSAIGLGQGAALWFNRGVGAVFVFLGLRLAMTRQV